MIVEQGAHNGFVGAVEADPVGGEGGGEFKGSSNLWRPLDAAKEEEVLKCECKDKDALTAASQTGRVEQPFPRGPWAINLSDKPFPGRHDKRAGSF